MTLDDLLIYGDWLEENDIKNEIYKQYLNLLRFSLSTKENNFGEPSALVDFKHFKSFNSYELRITGNGGNYCGDGIGCGSEYNMIFGDNFGDGYGCMQYNDDSFEDMNGGGYCCAGLSTIIGDQ